MGYFVNISARFQWETSRESAAPNYEWVQDSAKLTVGPQPVTMSWKQLVRPVCLIKCPLTLSTIGWPCVSKHCQETIDTDTQFKFWLRTISSADFRYIFTFDSTCWEAKIFIRNEGKMRDSCHWTNKWNSLICNCFHFRGNFICNYSYSIAAIGV